MSNGIDFVIGGKDEAKPAMSSVEKSLSRLEGKIGSVAKSTKGLAGANSASAGAMRAASVGLAGISSAALMAGAAIGAVAVGAGVALFALVKLHQKSAPMFDAQTEAVRRLDSALRIRGAAGASAQMQTLAKNLEKLTGVSDNVTMGLMQQASGMGFAAGKMDDAAKAAIGLSHATGKDAAASMGDLKAALEGNFDAFTQINPQILYMRTNQEKLAAVMAIANQGLSDQAKDMTTVAGSGRRADSAMSSLMESIGAIMAPIRVLISAGLQQLATSLDSLLVPAVAYATSILANIGPIMDDVKQKVVDGINIIIGAFTFFEVIVRNLGSVWEMVSATVELFSVQIAESVMHTLTVEIPAYAAWFGENFVDLMRDALSAALIAVSNGVENIVDAFSALWDFIASGGQTDVLGQLGEIAGRGYLDGFKSSLTSLPDIAGRQLTEREKDLADKIGAIGGRLGATFADKMKERMIGVGDGLSGELQAASQIDLKGRMAVITQGVQATEGRLLTRGPGTTIPNKMDEIIRLLKDPPAANKRKGGVEFGVRIDPTQMEVLEKIQQNTTKVFQMEAIA